MQPNKKNLAHKLTVALWALLLFSILTHWALQWFLLPSETQCLKNKLPSDCVGLERWQCLDSAWQVEQMRNELLQERASRQDLECDKIALERQVHTLLSGGGGEQIHTVSHDKLAAKHQPNHFIHVFSSFSLTASVLTSISSRCLWDARVILMQTYFPVNHLTTVLMVTSAEQRPEEQTVSSRGLPEVQQRGPGSPAGGARPGAGGEAGRGGKVRRGSPVGNPDEALCG